MEIGDLTPEIWGKDQDGKLVCRDDYKGKKVVLYFYPKDNTPGCTAEACSLRDHHDELLTAGYDVVGVSADGAESHQSFRAEHDIPFRLIADEDKTLINAMGVWGERNKYGKITIGLNRTTFLLDEEGRVERIFRPAQIRSKEHATQILKAIGK